ncbi:MAG: recombinase family protein [Gallionellaceae bacterium]|nr:recombinase family protein [Gallionellaceae bacterium]
MTSLRCATYARYSFDSQSPTSIDDQLTRCRDTAAKQGLTAHEGLVFKDQEVSGYSAKQALNRPGYLALIAAWDAGQFDVLIVDELSRLARNPRQQLELFERLDTGRVRLITANGIDSSMPQWRLLFGIQGLMAQEESRSTSFRVKRGMLGQLQRGFMIAAPAFGYIGERVTEDERELGTRWVINEIQAAIVREMYERRGRGESYAQVASWLNSSGVHPGRSARVWRATAVLRVLGNPIYRGEFQWNGSSNTRHKCKKKGVTPQVEAFSRPALRIVDDEVWDAAQPKHEGQRSGYGGGRNAFSGWIACGYCGHMLSASSQNKAMSCGTCAMQRLSGDPDAPASVPTISLTALKAVTRFALARVLDEQRMQELRRRLKARLEAGPQAGLKRLRQGRDQAAREVQQMLKLIRHAANDQDDLLMQEYGDARANLRKAQSALTSAEQSGTYVTASEVEAQLAVDASTVTEKLLDDTLPPEQVRSVLMRLFPRFVFLGRESSYIANFEIEFAPGAVLAWLSNTAQLDATQSSLRIRIAGSARRPVVWQLTELPLAAPVVEPMTITEPLEAVV